MIGISIQLFSTMGWGRGIENQRKSENKSPLQPFRAQALWCRNTYMMCFGTMSYAVTHGNSKMGI